MMKLRGTKLYNVWKEMRQRCNNPKHKHYKRYGDRGIKVCKEWDDPEAFYNWAVNNGYKEGLTLDRINNDKGYSPDNCRWATIKEQCKNRSSNHLISCMGKTLTMIEWSELLKIPYDTLRARLNDYHWSIEKALTTPVRNHKPYRIFVKKGVDE